jgi:hypothetical protein
VLTDPTILAALAVAAITLGAGIRILQHLRHTRLTAMAAAAERVRLEETTTDVPFDLLAAQAAVMLRLNQTDQFRYANLRMQAADLHTAGQLTGANIAVLRRGYLRLPPAAQLALLHGDGDFVQQAVWYAVDQFSRPVRHSRDELDAAAELWPYLPAGLTASLTVRGRTRRRVWRSVASRVETPRTPWKAAAGARIIA